MTGIDFGENWFTYPTLYRAMVDYFDDAHFVEVGSWKGRSSFFMADEIIKSGKNIRFDCVDTWEWIENTDIPKALYHNLWETFLMNIEPVKRAINPVRAVSWEAADRYKDESLDFVFIDAAHDEVSFTKDLDAWYPKVKKGGVIAGHDYRDDVKKVIDKRFEVEVSEGCWIKRK